jgi:Cof subfamily protein (haloacid dehalogenase superfamily)
MIPSANPQPIKLIAVDLDGTLLNSHHEMTARTEKALKAAVAQGVHVVIATGKTFLAAQHLIERLGLKTPGIFVQGTVSFNADGSVHSQQTIDPPTARQIITFAEDRGHQLGIYSGNRIFVRKLYPRMEELTMHYHEPMPEAVGGLQNLLDNTPVNKIIAIYPGDERRTQALRWQLQMQVNGSARLLSAGIPDEIELLPPNASKAAALKSLLKEFGVPASQALAIGDGENDIEMLQLVGMGVAVGNAGEHVKQVAQVVVASNDEDGVAEAIERFVLNVKQPELAVEGGIASDGKGSQSNGGSKL